MNQKLTKIFLSSFQPDRLLARLFSNSKNSQEAWEEFLQRYSKLILSILWKYEKNYDIVMDRFIEVCSKLCENNFSLLKKYRKDFNKRSPKFSTWLAVIVNNLCIDLYRKLHGRKRFPKGIKNLTTNEQKFFILYYWKGLRLQEISDVMNLNSSHVKENASDILTRIESILIRKPKANESITILPFDDETFLVENSDENNELELIIENVIESLPPQDKIIVRLRFWENLSAKEISEIINIKPYYKVYSVLEKALKLLREKVEVHKLR